MWFEIFLPFFVWDLLHCDTIGYLSFTFRNLPQAFCIFRIMGNPKWLGNLNVNVESCTSNILILDPCFSSCLVERFTFGNVGHSPTNEQWSIEKNLLLYYKCGGILSLSKPTFQICGCFVHHIQVLHLLWYCNNCGALLKNDSITQTSDRYINSDNMMMFKGKKVGLDTYKTYVICVNLWDSLTSLYLQV
jgi:hypothetical protein